MFDKRIPDSSLA